jgi:hypothetical protein
MTDPAMLTAVWLGILKVLRHQDFQEKSLMERKTGFP